MLAECLVLGGLCASYFLLAVLALQEVAGSTNELISLQRAALNLGYRFIMRLANLVLGAGVKRGKKGGRPFCAGYLAAKAGL